MADYVTLMHECRDFPVWRKAYDADAPRRASAGLKQIHLLRNHANPQVIGLMFEASDLGKAKAMSSSADLAAAMTAAGVIGKPRIGFRRGTYQQRSAPIYATMIAQVGDYDTLVKAYAVDAADRKAAGLTDLGMLQSVDDPGSVFVIWAVEDIARANAFFDSPALAAHMVGAAGVIGRPERYFWKP
jgi:hypothetical protein